jgi:hypothetical protein
VLIATVSIRSNTTKGASFLVVRKRMLRLDYRPKYVKYVND